MRESSRQRRCVRYSGHVQGVGFRYTTLCVSRAFAVTGYVLNLPDGRVEVLADGYPGVLDRFLAAVSERLRYNIDDVQTELVTRDEAFTTFSIRY
jgi:acylphosphatase